MFKFSIRHPPDASGDCFWSCVSSWQERGPEWEGLTWDPPWSPVIPEGAVGGPALYLVSQPVRCSCLTGCMLPAGAAVQRTMASCADCFGKTRKLRGRASYRYRLSCSQTWKGHSWAADDRSPWLCPTPRAGVKTRK